MPATPTHDRRIPLVLLALGVQAAILAWDHFHGGVASHHLLANRALPAVSSWWGLLLTPILAWWAVAGVQRRAVRATAASRVGPLAGFLCALAYGGVLALLFSRGSALVEYLFFGLLALALVVRLWHGEYLLGFVSGMMFVTGPILPAMFGAVIALFSWLAHTVARAVWRRLRARRGLT